PPHVSAAFLSSPCTHPPALLCSSPLTRRTPPFNTSLLFSPLAPNSTLQHFAAVLPSRAEVNPPTLRCCSPLMRRSQPFNSSLLFSPHALKSALNPSLPLSPHAPNTNLQQFTSQAEVYSPTLHCCSPITPLSHPLT